MQPFDRQYNSIHGLRNGTTVTKRLREEECAWWAYMRFYRYRSAPIWRRLDVTESIAHRSRDHVVLIQPFDRQYNSIHGLRNGKTVTNRPRRGGGLTGGSIGTTPI